MQNLANILKYGLSIAVVIYVGFCLTVYLYPEWFFYNPAQKVSSIEKASANGYPGEQVEYDAADGHLLLAWYSKPEEKKKIIVLMPGNSYNIEHYYTKILPLSAAGYGTFLPEYRGFGAIEGKINQKNMESDMISAIQHLYSLGYKNSDIVIYGISLGSHMATNTVYHLGQEQPFAGLVLEVPFSSLVDVVKKHVWLPLPLDLIVQDKYENMAMISHIKTPLLVMGAEKDRLVPVGLAKNLYNQAVEPKKLIVYPGATHNNLYDYRNYQDILNWLEQNEKN